MAEICRHCGAIHWPAGTIFGQYIYYLETMDYLLIYSLIQETFSIPKAGCGSDIASKSRGKTGTIDCCHAYLVFKLSKYLLINKSVVQQICFQIHGELIHLMAVL